MAQQGCEKNTHSVSHTHTHTQSNSLIQRDMSAAGAGWGKKRGSKCEENNKKNLKKEEIFGAADGKMKVLIMACGHESDVFVCLCSVFHTVKTTHSQCASVCDGVSIFHKVGSN